MTKIFSIKLIFAVLVACSLFNVAAQAKNSCSKKMLATPSLASDQCLSDQFDEINLKIENRYANIIKKLPETPTPETDTEYEGLSKKRMEALYISWKNYQDKACSADASSYGVQRRYENRMHTICWIPNAKQHLVFLKRF